MRNSAKPRNVSKHYEKHIYLPILLCLLSCKNENSNKSIEHSLNKKIEIKKESDNQTFLENDYEFVYKYSGENSNQLLGINILDEKTIKFHLITETLPCDTEYLGKAIAKDLIGDGEVDNDEEGGYFVIEYFKEEKNIN